MSFQNSILNAVPPKITALVFFLCVAAYGSAQMGNPPIFIVPNPIRALSAGPSSDFPNVSGHFEDPTITNFQYSPTWAPWTMGAGTGIAANGSTLTFLNPNAPEGTHVAFIEKTGTMTTPFMFSPGIFRLKFYGAQRVRPTGVDRQVVQISIGTTKLFEQELTGSSYAVYTTRAMRFFTATIATVTFKGLDPASTDDIAFIDKVEIEPIRDWNNPTSWDLGIVPTATHDVVIPTRVEVAMTGASTAATVTVENGELLSTFDASSLAARWVKIAGNAGRFEIGHERVPFTQPFTLTLTGAMLNEDEMGAGSKFLMSMDGGRIDMHGKDKSIGLPDGRRRTWTKLASTVTSGFTQIVLTQPVNWDINDEIVVTGSSTADSFHNFVDQSEKRTINGISGGGTILTLAPPTGSSYNHFGASDAVVASTYTYSNGTRSWTLDRRAEVGLLSHNVKIVGEVVASSPEFGGHVMMMKGPCCSSSVGGKGRFSNVEFYELGQKKKLGRYPIHWHMQHDQGLGQYVKWSSIHKSFNRAVTIHGSENVDVEGNVAYDHMGHGMFLEDGSERFNKFYHNLALTTRKPMTGDELLPSDNSHAELQNRSPATFWITNPNNEFVGNSAAGTIGTGYWFIFPPAPLGLSGDPTKPYYSNYFAGLQPDKEPLGLFVDNVCHTSANGFDVNDSIDTGHNVVTNHAWAPTTSAPQYLDRFTVYGCFTALYSGAAGPVYEQIRFRENVLADNFFNCLFASFNVLEDSAVIANTGTGFYSGNSVAYTAYDGAGRVFNTHFDGFTTANRSFLGDVGAANRHTYHRVHGLTFNPPAVPFFVMEDYAAAVPNYTVVNDPQDPRRWGIAIRDEDGSLGGTPGTTIVTNHPMMRSIADTTHPNWICYFPSTAPGAYVSPYQFAHLLVLHPGATFPLPNLTLTRNLAGNAQVSFLNGYNVDYHKQFPLIVNVPPATAVSSYELQWPTLPTPHEVNLSLDDLVELATGTHVTIKLSVAPAGGNGLGDLAGLTLTDENGAPITSFATLGQLRNGSVTGYFVDSAAPTPKPVFVRFVKPVGAMTETIKITW